MIIASGTFLLLTTLPLVAQANPVTFQRVWKESLSRSPEVAAANHEKAASDLAVSRAGAHWLPELTLRASSFSTNDPAGNFIGSLSQRSISGFDFTPALLNFPGFNRFESANLGLNLPLYQGGRKAAAHEAARLESEASGWAATLAASTLYASLLRHYGGLLLDRACAEALSTLSNRIEELLSRYGIGGETNPVGYSGILGLKGLSARIEADLLTVRASQRSHLITLSESSGLGEDLNPAEKHLEALLQQLPRPLRDPLPGEIQSIPEKLALQKERILAVQESAEKSRFLPEIGLFGSESLTHGARDTAFATAGGVYFSWSLLNPDHLNKAPEARERKLAALSVARQTSLEIRIERNTLNEREKSLEKSFALLMETDAILREQLKTTHRLFLSGSISALQLSEVYNRRADLIMKLRELGISRVELKSKKTILATTFEDQP
jgi:outer membrane protein TolC